MNNFYNVADFKRITNGGFQFYDFVMRKSGVILKENNNFQLKNPYYADKNPSLSINRKNGEYLFIDFGDNGYQGDVIDFAGHYYNLDPKTQLPEILNRACRDLNILEERQSYEKNKDVFARNEFTADELQYWSQYGISEEVLKKYHVYALEKFIIRKPDSKPFTIYAKQKNPIFAYQINDKCYKIYRPLEPNKRYKFSWLGKKPESFIFGMSQLPQKSQYLIITAGEKDVLSLASVGFNSICLNSETQNSISDDILNELSSRFEIISVLYDIDETGLKASIALSEKYSFRRIELPQKLFSIFKSKDVSDYLKICNSTNDTEINKESLKKLINDSNENSSEAWDNNENNTLPQELYDNLPEILSEPLRLFTEPSERDIVLISVLVVLSGCLPNIYGYYDGKVVSPNLFAFIVGQAGSGKGSCGYAKILGQKIHARLHSENISYSDNSNESDSQITTNLKAPKMLFIPANSSSTGIAELLGMNNGRGILFESEADTLSVTLKSEYGDYSELLRKSFHHETHSYYRRGNKEYLEIPEPKLSLLLSGTFNQLSKLIPSAENGLFSRFIFYVLQSDSSFRDVFEDTNRDKVVKFQEFAEKIEYLFFSLIEFQKPVEFSLTNPQKAEFNEFFSKLTEITSIQHGSEILGSAKRLAIICFRVSMILTILRRYNRLQEGILEKCSDEDFQASLMLCNAVFKHTVNVFACLPKFTVSLFKNSEKQFYEALPVEFKRVEGLEVACKYNISRARYDKMLANSELFIKIRYSVYRKIEPKEKSP